jgi:hypothetical protein
MRAYQAAWKAQISNALRNRLPPKGYSDDRIMLRTVG